MTCEREKNNVGIARITYSCQAEQGGKEKKTILGEPVVSRHSPDDELQLHPEEQFDSPGQSPGGLKQNIKPGSQVNYQVEHNSAIFYLSVLVPLN